MSAEQHDPNARVYTTVSELQEITRDTVKITLASLGVDVENPLQMQQDFARLREWRMTMDAVRRKGVLATFTLLASALLAALLIGAKTEMTRLLGH